ncbi:hypothetical protein V501_06130 [Pseudogymnoascus sp. VKM F-4519 (FW-2642)]|nr:hypothetical protein V501_06130 [Pseudogymnoascus sp. VKM F-4519 (FW-2642)]
MGVLPPRSIRASDVDGGVMRGFRSEDQNKDDEIDMAASRTLKLRRLATGELPALHAYVQEYGVMEIPTAAFGTGELTSPPDEESADPTGMYHITVFMDRAFGAGKDNDHIGSCLNPTKMFLLPTDRDDILKLRHMGRREERLTKGRDGLLRQERLTTVRTTGTARTIGGKNQRNGKND